MKNTVLMTSLSVAILAGGAAVAASDKTEGRHHMPRHSFEDMDANGDGKLMKDEVEAHMTTRFKSADTDGNGSLSVDELVERASEKRAKRAARYAGHMIDRYDADGDGELSQNEMRARHKGDMFARMDADKDGAVTVAEFDDAQEKMRKHRRHKHKEHRENHKNGGSTE